MTIRLSGGPLDGRTMDLEVQTDVVEFQDRDVLTIFERGGPGRLIPGASSRATYRRSIKTSDVFVFQP